MADRTLKQGERIMVRARAAAGQSYVALPDVYLDPGESTSILYPASRNVNAGEDITAILEGGDRDLILKPGDHRPHRWPAGAGGRIVSEPGARVTGGGIDVSDTVGVTYLNLVVRNALRCVWATDAQGLLIDGFDVGKDSSNGFYFRGLVQAEVRNGSLHDVNRMVRCDTTSSNDFGAMACDFHDTLQGSDIWMHDIRGYNCRVADVPPVSFNYAVTGDYETPAPPLGRSFDYVLDEGCFAELWQAKGVRIGPGVELDNVQVILETGRSISQNGPDCQFTIDGLLAYRGATPAGRNMRGILARSAVGSLIQHATLADLTDWGITTAATGNFWGALDLDVRDVINVSPSALIRGRSAGVTMDHNFLAGTGVAGDFGPGPSSLSGDPKFVSPATGDYHLQSTSPARNKAHDGSDMGAFA